MRECWTYKYVEETGSNSWDYLQPVPLNLTLFKGQRGVILSRNFTKFILEDYQKVSEKGLKTQLFQKNHICKYW